MITWVHRISLCPLDSKKRACCLRCIIVFVMVIEFGLAAAGIALHVLSDRVFAMIVHGPLLLRAFLLFLTTMQSIDPILAIGVKESWFPKTKNLAAASSLLAIWHLVGYLDLLLRMGAVPFAAFREPLLIAFYVPYLVSYFFEVMILYKWGCLENVRRYIPFTRTRTLSYRS